VNDGSFTLTLNDLSPASFLGAALARGADFFTVVILTGALALTVALATGAFLVVFLAVAILVMPLFSLFSRY
jgi:hypothetical protein